MYTNALNASSQEFITCHTTGKNLQNSHSNKYIDKMHIHYIAEKVGQFFNCPTFSAISRPYSQATFQSLTACFYQLDSMVDIRSNCVRLALAKFPKWQLALHDENCLVTLQWSGLWDVISLQTLCWEIGDDSRSWNKNIETVSGPCNTCFWYARAPAVRNTSRGGIQHSLVVAFGAPAKTALQ